MFRANISHVCQKTDVRWQACGKSGSRHQMRFLADCRKSFFAMHHCTRDGATCHQLFPHSGGMSPPRGNFSIFVTVGYSNLPPIMPGLMHHEGSGKAKLFKNMRMSVWKGESSAYNAHVLVICCPVCISEKQNTRQIPGSQ